MNCTIEYHENKKLRILIRIFKGTVTVTDIFDSWEYLIPNYLVNKNYLGVISDFRECNLQIGNDVCEQFERFFTDRLVVFKNLKLAQIIDTPSIAFPLLFGIESTKVQSQPFSTLEAAMQWILK